jgi:hypothetical protein
MMSLLTCVPYPLTRTTIHPNYMLRIWLPAQLQTIVMTNDAAQGWMGRVTYKKPNCIRIPGANNRVRLRYNCQKKNNGTPNGYNNTMIISGPRKSYHRSSEHNMVKSDCYTNITISHHIIFLDLHAVHKCSRMEE